MPAATQVAASEPALGPAAAPVAGDVLGVVYMLRGSGLLPWSGPADEFEAALDKLLQTLEMDFTFSSLTYVGSLVLPPTP